MLQLLSDPTDKGPRQAATRAVAHAIEKSISLRISDVPEAERLSSSVYYF